MKKNVGIRLNTGKGNISNIVHLMFKRNASINFFPNSIKPRISLLIIIYFLITMNIARKKRMSMLHVKKKKKIVTPTNLSQNLQLLL